MPNGSERRSAAPSCWDCWDRCALPQPFQCQAAWQSQSAIVSPVLTSAISRQYGRHTHGLCPLSWPAGDVKADRQLSSSKKVAASRSTAIDDILGANDGAGWTAPDSSKDGSMGWGQRGPLTEAGNQAGPSGAYGGDHDERRNYTSQTPGTRPGKAASNTGGGSHGGGGSGGKRPRSQSGTAAQDQDLQHEPGSSGRSAGGRQRGHGGAQELTVAALLQGSDEDGAESQDPDRPRQPKLTPKAQLEKDKADAKAARAAERAFKLGLVQKPK